MASTYRLVIVDVMGVKYAELENARINNLSWVLNDMGHLDFDVPSEDPKLAEVQIPKREVQVWKDSTLIWWGVLIRAQGDHKMVNFQAQTLEWYFTRRVIGAVPKTNLLLNGDMEAGTANWTAAYTPGALPAVNPLVTSDTTRFLEGTKSLKVVVATAGTRQYARQRFTYTNPVATKAKAKLTLSGWVYASPFTKPATANWGLYFERLSLTEPNPKPVLAAAGYGKSYGWTSALLPASTPSNRWLRIETSLLVPNDGINWNFDCRLFGFQGTAYWDRVAVTVDVALGFGEIDQALIVQGLVQHSQDAALGKSDLKIGTNCPVTGVIRTRDYKTEDRMQISETLAEFPTLFDGVDTAIEYTSTTRTFNTYFPRKGSTKAITLALGSNIISFSASVDADQTSSSVVVMADGEDGSDREEGFSRNAADLNGLVLEKVFTATPRSSISSLQAQANRGLKRYRRPVTVLSITSAQGQSDLLSAIVVGDVVPVDIRKGWIQATGNYRVTGIGFDPNTEQITWSIVQEDVP